MVFFLGGGSSDPRCDCSQRPPPPRTVLGRVCFGVHSSGTIAQLRSRTRVPEVLLFGARDDASGPGSNRGDTGSSGLGSAGGAGGEARGLHGQHGGGHCWGLGERAGLWEGKRRKKGVARGGDRQEKDDSEVEKGREIFRLSLFSSQITLSSSSFSRCREERQEFLVETERQRERQPVVPVPPSITMLAAASRQRVVAVAACAAPSSSRTSSVRRPLKQQWSQRRFFRRSPPFARTPFLRQTTTTTSTASAAAAAASASAALASTTFSAATVAAVCAYAALVTRPRSRLVR